MHNKIKMKVLNTVMALLGAATATSLNELTNLNGANTVEPTVHAKL